VLNLFFRFELGPCQVRNGNCEQICLPQGSGKVCQCEFGYTLDTDGISCSSGITIDSVYGVIVNVSYPLEQPYFALLIL